MVKKNLFFLFFFVLFFLHLKHLQAQLFTPVFENYTSSNGLPSSQVYQAKQDSHGFLWFATDNGISRFDGNKFTNYNYASGLCVRTVFGIYEDRQERIWFYSYSGEVTYFDYKDEEFHCPEYNGKLKEEVNGSILNGLFIRDDTLYTFNYDGDLFKVCLKSNQVIKEAFVDDKVFLSHYGEGNLVFGRSHNTLQRKDYMIFEVSQKQMNSSDFITRHDLKFTKFKQSSLPSAVAVGRQRFFYAIYKTLLYYNSKREIESFDLEAINTQSLFSDNQGLIWVGTYINGVYAYKKSKAGFENIHHFLSGYTVTSVMEDNYGGFWFTTLHNGVFYTPSFKVNRLSDYNEFKAYTGGEITALEKYENNLFFASNKGGVFKLHENEDSPILTLLESYDVKVNIRNLVLKDDSMINTGKIINVSETDSLLSLRKISKLSNEYYYILSRAYSYSVWKEENQKLKLLYRFKTGKEPQSPRHFIITDNRSVYFSNHSSLYYAEAGSDTSVNVSSRFGNNRTDIASITEWKGDTILVATKNLGVLVVAKGQLISRLDKDNGLPFEFCNHVFVDQGSFYVSSNQGICKVLNPFKTSESITLNRSNGLLSNEVLKSVRVNDKLYLATNKGLCIVDTSMFSAHFEPPESRIEEVSTEKVKYKKPPELAKFDYNTGYITIVFAAISFQNAFDIPYRYRLKDTEAWVYTKSTEVKLIDLSPGKYLFEVQAAGPGDNWGKSAQFQIEVQAAFWQTAWFIALIIGVILVGSTILYRLKVRRVNKLDRLRSALIHAQQQTLSNQINPHFIFNSLNSISYSLTSNDVRTSIRYLGKFGKLMRKVFENSHETFISLKEEVQVLKNYLEVEQMRLGEKLSFEMEVVPILKQNDIYVPAFLLQPFVENAVWHGIVPKEGNGKVIIRIDKNNTDLLIEIVDDGVGVVEKLDERSLKRKSGLHTSLKRIKLINKIYNKDINFVIEPLNKTANCGTKVSLTIPLLTDKPKRR